jgi:hypothetical protein
VDITSNSHDAKKAECHILPADKDVPPSENWDGAVPERNKEKTANGATESGEKGGLDHCGKEVSR